MSKLEPVAFADVKVGDTIKSVSPCGTVHRGVVATKDGVRATDANGYWLASKILGDGWTLYRCVPKPAKFVPPDVPEESWHWTNDEHTEARKGRWTMRDDGAWVLHHDDFVPDVGVAPYWTDATTGVDDHRIANIVRPVLSDFLAWHATQAPIDPPAPEEPSGLGAVVEVDGARFVRTSTNNAWWTNGDAGVLWGHITQLGPVTVLSEGVTK